MSVVSRRPRPRHLGNHTVVNGETGLYARITMSAFKSRHFILFSFFALSFFLKIYYLFIHDRHREGEREAEIQAEGEAGYTQGARCGTDSGTPGSGPGVKVALKP